MTDTLHTLVAGMPRQERRLPCHDVDPEIFFAEHPNVLDRAKQVCADCPVRAACLDGALERGEPWGVWGGALFEGGRVIASKRARGRPRKSTAA